MTVSAVAVVIVSYLIGSVDFAVVVARARGVDIYGVGSGNPGTANVARSLGWRTAAVVLAGDVLKGVVAAVVGLVVADPALGFAAALAAVIGHCYPIWHRFRGGKGVATGGGAILVLAPWAGLALVVVWVVLARLLKISSVASLTVAILAVPAVAVAGHDGWALVWTVLMVTLIVARHRGNIERLVRGEERPLGPRGTAAAGTE